MLNQSFMAQFSAGLSEVIAPAPWPKPEFLPGAAPYASETWDNRISLGWKTSQVDMVDETLVFVRDGAITDQS